MKEENNVIQPSLQFLGLFGGISDEEELRSLEHVIGFNFYRAVETPLLTDRKVASHFSDICKENGIRWTCWSTRFGNIENLNISSLDRTERARSVERHKQLIDIAADTGTDAYAFLSGKCPENYSSIPEAEKYAEDSISELAEYSAKYSDLEILIEPLDQRTHKKNTVGPTKNAVRILGNAHMYNSNMGMVWDSAHISLMGEDLLTSLTVAGNTVKQIHLCNAVLNSDDSMYGDYHIMPGKPGYLTLLRAADLLYDAMTSELLPPLIPVAIEVDTPQGMDVWKVEEEIRLFLGTAIEVAEDLQRRLKRDENSSIGRIY